jgi:hypothetical protein
VEKNRVQQRQLLEWTVCADEQVWEAAQSPVASPLNPPAPPTWWIHFWLRYRGHVAFPLLLLTLCTGWWGWQRAQTGLAAVESEIENEIVAEFWRLSKPKNAAMRNEMQTLGIIGLPSAPGEIVTNLEIRNLGQDWATVDVTLQPAPDGPSYRQTRVYQSTERGWVRVEPTAAHWGARQQFRSQHFVFDYYAADEEAVIQTAPQIDALYKEMQTYLFPGLVLHNEMLTITIEPAQSNQKEQEHTGIVVASPAAMLVSSDIATSEVLLQSVMLALYNHLAIRALPQGDRPRQHYRLQNALRLWLIWERDVPLAVWREPLLYWLFEPPNASQLRDTYDNPLFAYELCAHHQLSGLYPLDLAVPIECWQTSNGEPRFRVWPYQSTMHAVSLGSLFYGAVTGADDTDSNAHVSIMPLPEPGPYAIMLATVFEYVAERYGREQLPRLLAEIPRHKTTETLIPALFAISASEFEENWRRYLLEQ